MQYIFLLFLSAALFGASTPVGKILLESLPPFLLAGLFYCGAAIGVAPLSLRHRNSLDFLRIGKKNGALLGGAILFGGILGPVLLLFGLRLASSASVAMWLNLELVATALLGAIFFRDHLNLPGWLGVTGTIIASAALSWHEGAIGVPALLLVAGACLCWGLDNHFTALIDAITPSQSTLWKGIAAGCTNISISLMTEPHVSSSLPIVWAVIVGIFSYGFSISLYIYAAQNIGATRSQMIFASAPFFGVVLSLFLLDESLSALQATAALLLAFSITLLIWDKHSHLHEHQPMRHTHSHRHDDEHHTHGHPQELDEEEHTHWHDHEPLSHAHPHWPDIHHRHSHGNTGETDSG